MSGGIGIIPRTTGPGKMELSGADLGENLHLRTSDGVDIRPSKYKSAGKKWTNNIFFSGKKIHVFEVWILNGPTPDETGPLRLDDLPLVRPPGARGGGGQATRVINPLGNIEKILRTLTHPHAQMQTHPSVTTFPFDIHISSNNVEFEEMGEFNFNWVALRLRDGALVDRGAKHKHTIIQNTEKTTRMLTDSLNTMT